MRIPEYDLFQSLIKDGTITTTMDDIRGETTKQPLIYTYRVPEKISYYQSAPIIRVGFVTNIRKAADNQDSYINIPYLSLDVWTNKLEEMAHMLDVLEPFFSTNNYFIEDVERDIDPDTSDDDKKRLYLTSYTIYKIGE